MRALSFFKLSPGGNPTLLFLARLAHAEQARVAEECLHSLHLGAEQAGFVDPHVPALRMAGGEFCLNATRCLGVVLALEKRLDLVQDRTTAGGAGICWRGKAQTSGMPEAVTLHVRHGANGFDVTVELSFPFRPISQVLDPGFTLVRLPGIQHLLVDAERFPFPAHWKEESARLRARYGLDEEHATGCVWWRQLAGEQHGERILRSDPVVAVRNPHTVCYESACGSGALALALAGVGTAGVCGAEERITIMQPSGLPIAVQLRHEGTPGCVAAVGGPVRLVARGETFVHCLDGDGAELWKL